MMKDSHDPLKVSAASSTVPIRFFACPCSGRPARQAGCVAAQLESRRWRDGGLVPIADLAGLGKQTSRNGGALSSPLQRLVRARPTEKDNHLFSRSAVARNIAWASGPNHASNNASIICSTFARISRLSAKLR